MLSFVGLNTISVAGGETVATFLAAVTYYLCKSPVSLKKLQQEIRDRYQSYDQIDAISAQHLPYVHAIISEGLRIYPPGAQGFPRTSPGAMVDGYWIPKGVSDRTRDLLVTNNNMF